MTNFCPTRYSYGKKQESDLLKKLQDNLGEDLVPTVSTTDKYDYETENYLVELKSRRNYKSNQFNNWLISTSKFQDSKKKIVIYYYWDGDSTLWRYNYNPDHLTDFILRKSPISNQDHYDIPKTFFTLVI
jgi:hypothetical protein